MKPLGIIPARANSRRLPGKNLAICAGKPLLQWTCEAAQASRLERFIVSTDCPEVVRWCEDGGWPWVRRKLATSGDVPIQDVIGQHVAKFRSYSHVVLLQPTSPLRTAADIDACLDILATGCDSVASYTDIGKHQELLTTNGAVFGCKRQYATERLLRGPDHRCYLMPPERSNDVDEAAQLAQCHLWLTSVHYPGTIQGLAAQSVST